jgi:hypothetical protein
VTPDQAIALLSVKDWPPQLEHWPPKDKARWKPGMHLVGRIETVLTLPRPEGSKKRGEPYTALYVRREGDQRLVMFHGWHTAAADLDGMHPAPGLLFAAYYRGEESSGFENFKYIVAPYDPPAQQTRQETGQSARRSTQAPEGEATAAASPSGSNGQVRSVAEARAYVQGQPAQWRERFGQILGDARSSGEMGGGSRWRRSGA